MAGVEWPRLMAFSVTISGVRVDRQSSSSWGSQAFVASCTSTVASCASSSTPLGSDVSPRMTSLIGTSAADGLLASGMLSAVGGGKLPRLEVNMYPRQRTGSGHGQNLRLTVSSIKS